MALLTIDQIEKYYGAKTALTKALDQVSFSVEEGEFVGIMGASGSGKTTLLNCIATIDTVTAGHIYLDDVDITALPESRLAAFRQKNLGFIFQDYNLLDTLTIGENIALAPLVQGESPKDVQKLVHSIALRLGIEDIVSKFPYEVSGGQRQRCACARALIQHPRLILADKAYRRAGLSLRPASSGKLPGYERADGRHHSDGHARSFFCQLLPQNSFSARWTNFQ